MYKMYYKFIIFCLIYYKGDPSDWQIMFDTNVIGLSICSKEAVTIMIDMNIEGHIINLNSR